jgi:hypothetical protein
VDDLDTICNSVFLSVFVDDRDQAFFDFYCYDPLCSELCRRYGPHAGARADIEKAFFA